MFRSFHSNHPRPERRQQHPFYVVSHEYDSTDERRIPHNDPEIGYDWMAGPKIT